MTNIFSLIFATLVLVSCGKGGGGGSSSTSGNSFSEENLNTQVPTLALTFNTNIETTGFERAEEEKIQAAADLIQRVVSSEEFKNKILNHQVNGKKTFVDNGGLTNAQIYKKILEGAEVLNPSKNNAMDLTVVLYQASNNTVGYTYPNETRVWMNDKYFKQRNAAEVTTNLVHEWLHKLGFQHDVESTPSRAYSVPYAVGYLVRNLARKMS